MCGILGTNKKISDVEFKSALNEISYRGPDYSAVLDLDGIKLGHNRLSIIDLSPLGQQPMKSGSGNNIIVFNGEIYNYKELKKNLVGSGVIFKGNSDTEVIIEGYEKEGIEFFKKMRGMWSLAIFDKKNNKIVLTRDFFGIKPLYYFINDKDISFSSELRPLSKIINFIPDPLAYQSYFSLGAMFFDRTGVSGVKQLLPGQVLEFSIFDGGVNSHNLDITDNANINFENLESVISSSIKAHFVSDVPVSILFSGGIDSSIIASLSKKNGFNPTCYFVEMEDNLDKDYAENIANEIGLSFEKISLEKNNFIESYEEVLQKIDIPVSDVSIIPTSAIFKKVKERTKVALSGEGGDELFGGYLRHKYLKDTQIKNSNLSLPSVLSQGIFPQKNISPLFLRLQGLLNAFSKDTISTYALNSSIIYNPRSFKDSVSYIKQNIENLPFNERVPDSLLLDLSMYLPYILMVKGDRASMFNSVEARVPFLDKDLVGYVFSKYEENLDDLYFKKELKSILSKYISKDLVYRKKQGFGVSRNIFSSSKVLSDFITAFKFHKEREDLFGKIVLDDINKNDYYELILNKYPRFAFALISSYHVWKRYGQ